MRERFVWEVLAPRLLHPSRLALIQALLKHRRPLTLGELAEAVEITKDQVDHECRSMQEAGVLETVSTVPIAGGERDEPSYFFPKNDEPITSCRARGAPSQSPDTPS